MVHCLSCGAPNPLVGARFCVQCGARLPTSKESLPVESTAPAEPPKPAPRIIQTPAVVPAPVPGPRPNATPHATRKPPPESVRLTTGAAKELPAPSSYSFVSDRPPASVPRRPERPTLPGGGEPSAPGIWNRGPTPSSMEEALARMSPQADAPKESTLEKDKTDRALAPTISDSEATAFPLTPKQGTPGRAYFPTMPSAKAAGKPEASPVPLVPKRVVPPSSPGPETKPTPRPMYGPSFGTSSSSPDSRPLTAPKPPYSRPEKAPDAVASPPSAPDDDLSWAPPPSEQAMASSAVFGLRKSVPPAAASPETQRKAEAAPVDVAGLLGDLEDSVDSLLDDIDAGFDRIVGGPGSAQGTALTDHESKEVRELFSQIAAGHMRPVRDFMIELKLGDPPREWIDLVAPAVTSLGKSADGMGLGELRAATDVYLEALDAVSKSGEPRVTADQAKELFVAFELLAAELPGAFDLNEERDRREPIIVQSLLRQVPDVRKVALDKLYAAGLTSLEMYYAGKPYDVAQAAGLSEELAGRIIDRFARHRLETSEGAPDLQRTHEHKELEALVTRLEEQNEAFDAASMSWSSGAVQEKKKLRKERNDTVLELNVLLARLGEVDLVKRLERLPFQTKAEELRSYLAEVKERAAQGG